MSQLDLALDAEISTRHLSFVESGRSAPSRDMVLTLAETLEVPLRDRNALLLAAGFAPVFPERSLDDPALRPVRDAVQTLLTAHEPFPALAVDRHWTLVAANRAIAPLLAGASPKLLEAPVNVLRLSLHPEGLAPRIANLPEWREHILARLRRQADLVADPVIRLLLEELSRYPVDAIAPAGRNEHAADLAVTLRLTTDHGVLSFLSTTMMFGTPTDVTLSELSIETFLPADAATHATMHKLVQRDC